MVYFPKSLGFFAVLYTIGNSAFALSRRNQLTISTQQHDTISLYAAYATAAYCGVAEWNCGPLCRGKTAGTQLITQYVTPSDIHGYIAVNPNTETIIVAFRGTEDILNTITDAKFFLTDYKPVNGAKIHNGMYAGYLDAQSTVLGNVGNLTAAYPSYSVVVTGHSLGGGLATLAAADIYQNFGIKPLLYTFGEPRGGNAAYANYINSLNLGALRTVHTRDLIPHLPPKFLGFEHHDTEIWISTSGPIFQCISNEESDCSNSIVPFPNMVDHLDYLGVIIPLSCYVNFHNQPLERPPSVSKPHERPNNPGRAAAAYFLEKPTVQLPSKVKKSHSKSSRKRLPN